METVRSEMKRDVPSIPTAAHSMFESFEKPVEETYNRIRTKTVEAYDSSIELVRDNPVKSLAIALGIGALAGYLLKRR